MSRRRRIVVAAVAAAAGLAGAGTAATLRERRRIESRDDARGAAAPLGSLRSPATHVVTEDGVDLHVEVSEPEDPVPRGDEPTVVLVHGYALNLECWHFQLAHLRRRHRVVLYDQRSHGRSQRSAPQHATIDQLGADLATVLDQVVPDGPVVLVGHSMGGMTILALADQHPELFEERVAGVALLSTTAGGLRPGRVVLPYVPERLTSQLAPRLVAALAHGPSLVDRARRRGSDVGYVVTDRLAFGAGGSPELVAFVDAMLSATSYEVIAEFFPNFDTLDLFHALEVFAPLPTVILCGTHDRLTSVGHSRKMASLLPSARLVEVADAGHMVILERPDLVNRALDDLLEQARARRASVRPRSAGAHG